MAKSIERRIRHTVLGAVATTLFVAIASVLIANEQLEQSILSLDMQTERDFMLELAQPDKPLDWKTATLRGLYIPTAMVGTVEVPQMFRPDAFPFAGEVEAGDETFMVTSSETAKGRLYLAKEITIFEQQESLFARFLAILSVAMVILGSLLARFTGRRLAAPLARMAQQIAVTEPAPAMPRISVQYSDLELQAISGSFNRFLDEIESYVQREKSLLGMASHELRTPIAIIAGALDGIETRGQASPMDERALQRIRRAVDEMGANVDVILKLTRREVHTLTPVPLGAAIDGVLDDATTARGERDRVRFHRLADPVVMADPALVKMLVRNLLHNALQHTSGTVDVRLGQQWIEIADQGGGLPEHYRSQLAKDSAHGYPQPLSGLGLFIVTLVCERLGWKLRMEGSSGAGLVLRVMLTAGPEHS